jgi:hypothetical protein
MALVIHSYYIAGVSNFGDFVSNAKAPMYVEFLHGLTFELNLMTFIGASYSRL